MRAQLDEPRVALGLLVIAYVLVAAWTASWPDHPLIPDEVMGKAMAEAVRQRGVPWAEEPIRDYRSGAFAPERYGYAYEDHVQVYPPVGIAVAYEQGVLGPKIGRAVTLAIGTFALAYLGWRVAGPVAGGFAGTLYLVHPAVLYFHQSYFANPGGTAWFLAFLALLEASRRRWWLAPVALAAAGVALLFRVEFAIGVLAASSVAWLAGPLRDRRAALSYYGMLAIGAGALLALSGRARTFTAQVLFGENFEIRDALLHPLRTVASAVERYVPRVEGFEPLPVFLQNVYDYFPYFFPLAALLAVAGGFTRARDRTALWCLFPMGVQVVVSAVVVLPGLWEEDYNLQTWLESSITRYFLVAHATLVLLAAIALAALVERAAPRPDRRRAALAVALVALVATASVVQAVGADHGVAWGNERRAWFREVDATAATFGQDAVFVGRTPSKVILSRPVLAPNNVGYDDTYLAQVGADLLARGRPVFAVEPWFWDDHNHSVARAMVTDGRMYWTDTGVVVPCACGESARFFRLHATNATLVGVERLEDGAFIEEEHGLRAAGARAFFWPDRDQHVRQGLGRADPVRVSFEYLDESPRNHTAGYVNLPVHVQANAHALLKLRTEGTGEWRRASFLVNAGEVVNGPFFVSDGLLVRTLEVRES